MRHEDGHEYHPYPTLAHKMDILNLILLIKRIPSWYLCSFDYVFVRVVQLTSFFRLKHLFFDQFRERIYYFRNVAYHQPRIIVGTQRDCQSAPPENHGQQNWKDHWSSASKIPRITFFQCYPSRKAEGRKELAIKGLWSWIYEHDLLRITPNL
jgi:hypothetical protein